MEDTKTQRERILETIKNIPDNKLSEIENIIKDALSERKYPTEESFRMLKEDYDDTLRKLAE